MITQAPVGQVERDSVRLAAVLLLAGVVVTAIAGFLHPEGADANDHQSIFAIYAASQSWTVVHLGQFIGMVIISYGLVALFFALDVRSGVGVWLNRFALLSAGAALALYGVLQAVDGVGLKQAVNAWASADNADKAARFAAAETVRWLEWAVRSYQSFVFGLALILFGAVIAVTGRVSRPIGYLMALCGLCYLAQGWIIGSSGFSSTNQIPTLLGIGLILAWTVWLLIAALRMKTATLPETTSDATT
ncbi:MAG: hypothetical protein ACJ72M_13970 [Propionibacteriaceae bacterium]